MPETQVQEQIRILRSQNPHDRLRAATSLGKLGAQVRETHETLSSDYRGAVVSLAGALAGSGIAADPRRSGLGVGADRRPRGDAAPPAEDRGGLPGA